MRNVSNLALSRESIGVASIDTLLQVAGADDWTQAEIDRHKAEELAKAPRPNAWWYILRPLIGGLDPDQASNRMAFTTFLTLAATLVLMFFSIILLLTSLFWGSWTSFAVLGLIFSASAALFCTCFLTLDGRIRIRIVSKAHWQAFESWQYLGHYPPEASVLMRRVTALMPDAKFRVHALMQNDHILDPILEVDATDPATRTIARRFILVWDAKGKVVLPPA